MESARSADGTTIAFEQTGSGAPLVLIGGAFCDRRARAAGAPLAAELASRFTVFSYDRRGRGDSTDTAPYTVQREIEDLDAIIRAAGGRARVYGHSSGAVLALEGAAAGLTIDRLAVYEAPLVFGEGRAKVPVHLGRDLRELTLAGRRSDAAELFLTQGIGLPGPVVQQMKQGPHWQALEALAHTLSYDATLTADPDGILKRAASVRCPALVLDGGASPPWMRGGVERLAAAIPGARHATLEGQNHDVPPKIAAEAISQFLAG